MSHERLIRTLGVVLSLSRKPMALRSRGSRCLAEGREPPKFEQPWGPGREVNRY